MRGVKLITLLVDAVQCSVKNVIVSDFRGYQLLCISQCLYMQ